MALLIPIRGSDEVVEVKYTELPDDPTDVIDILKAEMATLDLWLDFAVAYYKQGRTDPFKQILQEASDPVVEDVFADAKKERIAILDTMASYYTTLASKQKEKSKRDEYFTQATTMFNKADKIEMREELTWVGKAVLLLCRGDVSHANDMFDSVLKANSKNIPAYLGKARIHFNNGQYEEALKCYKTALTLNPRCPASVRLGLGLCYSKLNKPNAARKAFERVLALDPSNVEALVGLAIMELNTEGTKAVVKAMTLLKTAYDINPNNSVVLNHLANHYFYKKDEKRAFDLAYQAYHNSEVDKVRAESCFHMARTFHCKGEFASAFQYYFQAIHHWEDFPLAQYGIGQMYIHKKEYEKAISSFEKVLAVYPDNYETLRMLGSLYAQTNRKPRAYQYFKKVTEIQPADVEAWVELAQLVENNYPEALDAYEKAQQILDAKKEPVPAELWNNIGTMKYMMGQYEEALQAFNQAMASSGTAVEDFKSQDTSIIYNIARTCEMLHDYNRAKQLYIGILKVHPSYTDCYMRLGSMAKMQGLVAEANEWYKDTFMITDKNPDVWAMMANLHLSKDEWLPAQRKFEKVLHDMEKDDTYCLLSLGNIYYNAKASGAEKKEREEKYLRLAHDFYWKALQMDSSNIYAANGVAIIQAERGKLQEAKDFFVQVREATADFPDVWINLANVYLVQGQHVNAIKMYQKCLKNFYFNKDVTVLMLLARAYFVAGRMEECKQTIIKAIHIQPENKAFWFNLALAQEQFATEILRREKKTSADVKKALINLQQALATLKSLQQNPGTVKGPQIGNKAEKHATYCQTTLDLGIKALAHTEHKEKKELEMRRKAREEAEEALNKKAKEDEARLQEAILQKQREEMEALAFQQKVESLLVKPIRDIPKEQEEEEARSKKKRRKKKDEDNFIVEDEPEGAENGEQGIQQMRERSTKAKALQELAQRTRDRQGEEKEERRRKRRGRDEDEEEAEPEERPEKRKKKEKKHKKEKREKKHKKEKKHRKHRDEEEEEEEQDAEEGNENEEPNERKRIKKTVSENDNLDDLFASDDDKDKKKQADSPQQDKMRVDQPKEENGNTFEDIPKTPE